MSLVQRLRILRHQRRDSNVPVLENLAAEFKELKHSGKLPDGFYGNGGPGRAWTQQEKAQFVAMKAANCSTSDIAAALKRTVVAIQSWSARRSEDHPRAWAQSEEAELLAMKQRGLGIAEMAQAMSRSYHSVHAKYKRLVRARGASSDKPVARTEFKADASIDDPRYAQSPSL
jgi:hypothetical protein